MSSRINYCLPELDTLPPDTLYLRAPVSQGAVLLNSYDVEPEREPALAITINPPTIVIARNDGSPLQIADVDESRLSFALAEPVPDITLHKGDTPGMYRLVHGEKLRVQDPNSMRYFFDLIASYSIDAQLKKQRAAEAAAAAKILDVFRD